MEIIDISQQCLKDELKLIIQIQHDQQMMYVFLSNYENAFSHVVSQNVHLTIVFVKLTSNWHEIHQM